MRRGGQSRWRGGGTTQEYNQWKPYPPGVHPSKRSGKGEAPEGRLERKYMPIAKRWSTFSLNNVSRVPNVYGAYELGNRDGEIIYIGEGRLQDRLRSHFSTGSSPVPGTAFFRYEQTGGKERAVGRQNALLRDFKRRWGRLPYYNQKSRG